MAQDFFYASPAQERFESAFYKKNLAYPLSFFVLRHVRDDDLSTIIKLL